MEKHQLQELISKDELEEAVKHIVRMAEMSDHPRLHNRAINQSGLLNKYEDQRRDNLVSNDEANRNRTQVRMALLGITNDLFQPAGAKKQRKGIRERRLKNQLLYFLAAAKILIILFLFVNWEAGSFGTEGFLGALGMLIPVFASYLSIMWKDTLAHRHHQGGPDDLRVNRSVQIGAYFILIAYFLVINLVIYLRGTGILPKTEQMLGLFALVESGLGVYVSQLVFNLFGERD